MRAGFSFAAVVIAVLASSPPAAAQGAPLVWQTIGHGTAVAFGLSQVMCIVGLDAEVSCNTGGQNHNQVRLGKQALYIAVDGTTPWIVNREHEIWYYDRAASQWVRDMTGGGRDIAAGNGAIWVIGTDGVAYRRTATTPWQNTGGAGTRVAVAKDGTAYVTDAMNGLWRLSPGAGWAQIGRNIAAAVAAGGITQNVMVITGSPSIQSGSYPANTALVSVNGRWMTAASGVVVAAVTDYGQLAVIQSDGTIKMTTTRVNLAWDWMAWPGKYRAISAGSRGGYCAIDLRGRAVLCGATPQTLADVGMPNTGGLSLSRIAVDADGLPWVIDNLGKIWRKPTPTPTATQWELVNGRAKDIAVGGAADQRNAVWVIGADDVTYYLGDDGLWKNMGGVGTSVSVDVFGNAWVTNSVNQIYLFGVDPRAGESKYASFMPGLQEMIEAVADGVFGLETHIGYGRWQRVDGTLTAVARNYAELWALGIDQVSGGRAVMRRAAGGWQRIPGGLASIEVDPLGNPMGVNVVGDAISSSVKLVQQ